MSKTAKLDQQIDQLQVELHAAKAQQTQIGEKLALDPANAELIAAAREGAARIQNLTTDIEILNGAREAASAADARAEADESRANALRNLASLEKLIAQRVKAAKQIDEALARLRQVNQNWLAVNAECSALAIAFRRYAYGNTERAVDGGLVTMKNAVINAIVDNVAESLKGFEFYQVASFNHLRHQAHSTESATADAEKSSERLLQGIRSVALEKGLV